MEKPRRLNAVEHNALVTRLAKRDVALVIGLAGVTVLTATLIVRAKAKAVVPPDDGIIPPPPPNNDNGLPPGIPALMHFENSPVTVVQKYTCRLWQRVIPDPGWIYKTLRLKVMDAAGRGVPNVPVLVWTSDVPDAEDGSVNIGGEVHTSGNPVELITDANGLIPVDIGYRLPLDIIMGCHSSLPWPIHCTSAPVVNGVYAKIKGTSITTLGQAVTSMTSTLLFRFTSVLAYPGELC